MKFCKAKLMELGESLQCDFCPGHVTQLHADVKAQTVTCFGCDTPVTLYDPETLPLIRADLEDNGFFDKPTKGTELKEEK